MFDKIKLLLGKKDILITKDMDIFTINDSEDESNLEHIIKNNTEKVDNMTKDKNNNKEAGIEEEEEEEEETKKDKKDKKDLVELSDKVPDNSTLAEENRVSDCLKKNPKMTREECSKKVKGQMGKERNKAVTAAQDTKEKVEICKDEYDFLKAKLPELEKEKLERKHLQDEYESFKKDFLEFKSKIEAKENAEKEIIRQDLIDKLNKERFIPKEELKEDTIADLEKLEKRLNIALKINAEGISHDEDFSPTDVSEDIMKKYRILPVGGK